MGHLRKLANRAARRHTGCDQRSSTRHRSARALLRTGLLGGSGKTRQHTAGGTVFVCLRRRAASNRGMLPRSISAAQSALFPATKSATAAPHGAQKLPPRRAPVPYRTGNSRSTAQPRSPALQSTGGIGRMVQSIRPLHPTPQKSGIFSADLPSPATPLAAAGTD